MSQAVAAARAQEQNESWAIWLYAFGYFAGYAPYSALTKAMSGGRIESVGRVGSRSCRVRARVGRRDDDHHRDRLVEARAQGGALPMPGPWTALSGLAAA